MSTDFCPRREKNPLLFLLLLPLAFGPGAPLAVTPLIANYMSCARAFGTAMNERFIVKPGSRGNDNGLLL